MRMKKIVDKQYLMELGLLRPIEGAILGFLIFTLLLVLLWVFRPGLAILLLFPGFIAAVLYSILFQLIPELLQQILIWVTVYLGSATLPTIIGALIALESKITKGLGIVLLVVYILILYIGSYLGTFGAGLN